MKFILIGMPGSGKSTVGKQLSLHLDSPFIDLDEEIEKAEGKKINEIFRERGEHYFREVESSVLQKLMSSKQDFVLATGGGAPCFHNGIAIINNLGISIFLDVPIEELLARVESDKNRPLLLAGDKSELRDRLTNLRIKRLSTYEQAAVKITGSEFGDVIKAVNLKT